MIDVVPVALAAAAAFATVLFSVPMAMRVAHRLGAIARPRADRLNARPVPTLGGLAVAAGVIVAIVILPIAPSDRLALLAGVVAMTALGLADDLRSVPPIARLVIEAVVAVAFVAATTSDLDAPLRIAGVLVAAVAFPVAINATNLVDNADGLAASLSTVTALILVGLGVIAGPSAEGSGMALAIAATCLGFLVYNRPPARVFMGDSGSLMLGFALAGVSAFIIRDSLTVEGGAHGVIAMLLPLAWALQVGDLAMVFVTRMRRGASPFKGGVDHTSHRLMAAGLGPWAMLFVLSAAAAGVGIAAVAIAYSAGGFELVAVAVIILGLAVGVCEALIAWRLPARRPDAGLAPERIPQPQEALVAPPSEVRTIVATKRVEP